MFIQERYPHTVSGSFDSRADALNSAQRLVHETGLGEAQVDVVEPGDEALPKKVEPESKRIFRTLLSSHAWFAGLGLLAGVALGLLLTAFGPAFARTNPFFTVLATGWVGFLATALLGGLTTLRPDRDQLIFGAREASRRGHWTVVAHCADSSEQDSALDQLRTGSLETHRSL